MEGFNNDWPLAPFDDKVNAQTLKREWEEWKRAFELVAEAKNIMTQRQKFVTLLARGGRALQNIYYNKAPVPGEVVELKFPMLVLPEFDNAIARLDDYFVGKTNPRIELEVFRSIKQESGENFNKFLIRLKGQAKHCGFEQREEDELLHQITMGAASEKVKDKGLEGVMTLDQLTQYAIMREMLENQKTSSKKFYENDVKEVALIREKPRRFEAQHRQATRYRKQNQLPTFSTPYNKQCFRCGSKTHFARNPSCPAINAECHLCKKKGHFAKECRTKSVKLEKKPETTVNEIEDYWMEDQDPKV